MSQISEQLRSMASKSPVICFVILTYGWSWAFWIPAQILVPGPQGLKLALTLTGGFGPAIAGLLLTRLRTVEKDPGPVHWSAFLIGAGLGLAAVALFRIMDGFGIDALALPADSPGYVYAVLALPVFLSGLIFSSIQSRNPQLRALYKGLVPDRQTVMWLIPVLAFLPLVLLIANALADMLGVTYEAPMYTTMSVAAIVPFLAAKMFTAAIMTGGNEEQGWRAVLLPILQKSANPLVATLIIVVIWELWHLPLTVGGLYGEGNPLVITLIRMTGMVPFAFLLTALYNASRGSVFLCVLFHACYNSEIMMFGGTQLASIVAVVFVAVIIFYTKMWRRDSAHHPI